MHRYIIALAISVVVAAAACGGGDDDGGGKGKSRGGDDAIALSGHWATDCTAESGSSYYKLTKRSFTGRDFSQMHGTYVDANCQQKALTQEQTGPFTIGRASDNVDGAFAINLTTDSFLVTLHSSDLVDAYNSRNVCGGNWVRNEARRYDRETCGDGQVDDDNTVYDLVLRDGNELYFGQKTSSRNGSSSSSRPTAIDRSKAFEKLQL